jgi:endonuclease YncB( thermonuclease family)
LGCTTMRPRVMVRSRFHLRGILMRLLSAVALVLAAAIPVAVQAADNSLPVRAVKSLPRPAATIASPVHNVCDQVADGSYVFRAGMPAATDTYHVPAPGLDQGAYRRPYVSPFKGYVAEFPPDRPAPKPAPRLICGKGGAVDGNTILLGRQSFRLFGMEAPSLGETCPDSRGGRWKCGSMARAELQRHLAVAPVVCEAVDQEGDAIMSAHCEVEGRDIAAAMVRDGFAAALYRDTPMYVQREGEAVRQLRGIWEAYQGADATSPAAVVPHPRRP